MSAYDGILKLLFPDKCIICGEVLADSPDFRICKRCIKLVKFTDEHAVCEICASPVSSGRRLCGLCSSRKRYFTKNASCVIYGGAVREAVLNFKFNNAVYAFRGFSEMIAYAVQKERILGSVDMIAAVPSGEKRMKMRGFNQCDLMAKYLSDKFLIPYADCELIKVKDIPPQSTLRTVEERFENIKGAFKITEKEAFKGKKLLLIDDVFTTGATLTELSHTLIKAGAKEVFTATAAIADHKIK